MSQWYEPSRPRPVEGGLQARSRRGAIGEQWWSRRFIEVLESFGMKSRLTRGRNYARAGQILSLEVSAGAVTAQVQGSRARPYRVRIEVPALDPAQWRRVEVALAGQALFRATLLAGDMPPEIEEVFAGCGTDLFPRSARDLAMSCSCPDWEVPCKHLAATCYLLAEAFDDDPFLVLAWRGRRREQLLARLRELTGAPDSTAPWAAGVTDRPLADCLDSYFSPAVSPARLRAQPTIPATAPDMLLRTLEPPPVTVRRRDLVDVLAPAYAALAATGQTPGTEGG
jgi:uncharacterized Zn finger protein